MTELSRILLNTRSAAVRRDLGDAHAMHRRVLGAFPDYRHDGKANAARAHYRVLYRIERTPGGDLSLLVQAAETADWSRLPEGYLAPHCDNAVQRRDLGPMLAAIAGGQRRRFRLRANVTRSVPGEPDGRGKRVEIVREDDACTWLDRQAERSGFRIVEEDDFDSFNGEPIKRIRATGESKVYGFKGGSRITFGSMLFEGELEIIDADAFRTALTNGVGRAKAYGFGLMSIARGR